MASPLLKATYGDRMSMGHSTFNRQDVISRDSVVSATLMLLSLCTLSAVAAVGLGLYVSPGVAILANYAGIGGSLLATVAMLVSPKLRKKALPIGIFLSVCQGLMLGGFTFSIGTQDIQGSPGWNLVGQALMGTFALFFIALILYRTGTIRMTGKFTKFLIFATAGFAALYGINIIIAMVTGNNLLMSDGPIPIIIGVVAIVLGSLNLIKDFDDVDRLVEGGTPDYYKWSLATSIVSNLVWLYIELLRVLYLIRR